MGIIKGVLTAILTIILISGCSKQANVEVMAGGMYRGDLQRTGYYGTEGPIGPGGGKWIFKTPSSEYLNSSPTIAGDIIYFGASDNHMYAIDKNTGEEKWKYKAGGAIVSTPAIFNGRVFFGSNDGNFYALEAGTGKVSWKHTLNRMVVSSPAVFDGSVYFGCNDSNLYSLRADNGEVEWVYKTDGAVMSSPAVYKNAVVVGSDDGFLYAVGAEEGKMKWKFDAGAQIATTPVISDGLVFFGNNGSDFYAVDYNTGDLSWKFTTDGTLQGSPAVHNGMVYFCTMAKPLVYALDIKNGKEIWKNSGESNQSPSIAGEFVYVFTSIGTVAYNIKTGEPKYKFPVSSHASAPVIENGVLYCADKDVISAISTDGEIQFGKKSEEENTGTNKVNIKNVSELGPPPKIAKPVKKVVSDTTKNDESDK